MTIELIPLPKMSICRHPEHHPPTHYFIPPGVRAVHTCPGCGKKTDMTQVQVTCSGSAP